MQQLCWKRVSALPRLRLSQCGSRWPTSTTTHLGHRWSSRQASQELETRINDVPLSKFRNFCIVAHVDHGKSTLSDRLLELTRTIAPGENKQVLDKLDVERERGITVKAQTCTMLYQYRGEDYLFNLVDTPGHVDFRAEVSSSFRSSDSALLLVDASQGIQAQTVANFYAAFALGLQLIPVVNKVDLPSADPERVLDQLKTNFELEPTKAVLVSAKTGQNIASVLHAVIEQAPPPVGSIDAPLKILVVDSWYDPFKGVVLLVRLFDGLLKSGDNITSFATRKKYLVGEVGIMHPLETKVEYLRAGQIGYCYPNMKVTSEAKIGDTFTHFGNENIVKPCAGFEEPKPMVFVGAFPLDQSEFNRLDDSIKQLVTNDRSVTLQKESSEALGQGWRMGFLGTLHASVFEDRLRQEHGGSLIITAPSVPYKVRYKDNTETIVSNPAEFPSNEVDFKQVERLEPFVLATITVPEEHLGSVIELCESNRGSQVELAFWTAQQVILKYRLPLAHLVNDFFGKLKGISKGYASLDYEDAGYETSDVVKLQLLVNKVPVDAIAQVVHRSQAQRLGKQWVNKFKDLVQREQFEVVIQASVGHQVVARQTVKAVRKDVTAKLYGGDRTRRMKLLEKQKAGKKRMQAIGRVAIEQKSFQKFLQKSNE